LLTYILKRIFLMVPTFFGITLVTFLIIRLAPGDPASLSVGIGAAGGEPSASAGGAAESQRNREQLILRAKVRLGLMREEGTVFHWEPQRGVASGRSTGLIQAVSDLAFHPLGAQLACATQAGDIHLLPLRDGEAARSFRAHDQAVNAIAFGPRGDLLASAGSDRLARVWDLASGARVAECAGHELLITDVAFSSDGRHLATASRDQSVRLWDAASGRELRVFRDHHDEVLAVAFAPGDTELISAGRDRAVMVRELGDESAPARVLYQARAGVASLALGSGGAWLALGLVNNNIDLVDAASGRPIGVLGGHSGAVAALAFHPGGAVLASASHDHTVRLWDLDSFAEKSRLEGHSGEVKAVAFSADGAALASGALDTVPVGLVPAYFEWLGRIFRLDFGRSFLDDRPVMGKVLEALPVTLELNLITIALIYLLSIPIGVFSAARRNSIGDQGTTLVLFLLYSMPSFWVATMLIILFGSPRGPTGGILPFIGLASANVRDLAFLSWLRDHLQHLILPAAALTYAHFAFLSRLVRSSMLETLSQDYIRTARAKGLPERQVIGRHALRNSLIPVITLFGTLLPALIGGSVIVEQIFSLPGMGNLSFTAILSRDYPVIMAITTLVAVLTMLGMLISDLLYCAADPRIQIE
jgi:peptide/nickel transport system permease protein